MRVVRTAVAQVLQQRESLLERLLRQNVAAHAIPPAGYQISGTCCICFEEDDSRGMISLLNNDAQACHSFHALCAFRWFRSKGKPECPLCRSIVSGFYSHHSQETFAIRVAGGVVELLSWAERNAVVFPEIFEEIQPPPEPIEGIADLEIVNEELQMQTVIPAQVRLPVDNSAQRVANEMHEPDRAHNDNGPGQPAEPEMREQVDEAAVRHMNQIGALEQRPHESVGELFYCRRNCGKRSSDFTQLCFLFHFVPLLSSITFNIGAEFEASFKGPIQKRYVQHSVYVGKNAKLYKCFVIKMRSDKERSGVRG